MDALKLNLKAKDQLHPFLTELMSGYSRFKGSQEWEGRGKILHWSVMDLSVRQERHSNVQADHAECHEGERRDHRRAITTSESRSPSAEC